MHRSAQLRIAHFHSSLGVYGAECWTLTLIRHLDPERFASSVITVGSRPGARAFHDVVRGAGFQALHLDFGGKLNPAAIAALRRLLIEQRIDVLHAHGFKSDVLAALATVGLPVRLVTTVHGWSQDEGLRIRLYESLGRLFLRRFTRIYPLSPALLDDLRSRGFPPAKLRLVVNGVDTSRLEPCFDNRKPRGAGDPLRILFVGRLCRPKGVYDLLRAFRQARFNVPAELRLAGEGPALDELQQLCRELGVEDRVSFLGFVEDTRPLFESSDVLVLPSYSEGIPRVVMEAFAAGLPVVGSSIPGNRQLIAEGETGWLTPVGDPSALARALEDVAARPDRALQLSVAARGVVKDRFSAHRQAREFEDEYLALCRGPSARPAASETPETP